MALRFRQRVALLVATAVGALLLVTVTGVLMMKRADAALLEVQARHLPLAGLQQELTSLFARIPRALQDAVSADDPEALGRADALRDQFLLSLRDNYALLKHGRAGPEALEQEFREYYALARSTTRQLMTGPLDEELVGRIEEMQQARVRFLALLNEATAPQHDRVEAAFQEAKSALDAIILVDILVTLVVVAVLASLSLWIVRSAAVSLRAISDGVQRLAVGDFSQPISVLSNDEFGQLAQQANAAGQRLKASRDELESFTYSVSHDLRAPLRAVDGFCRILAEDHAKQLDDEGQRVLQVILKNARKMGKLIDDLLTLSGVGRRELTFAIVNMQSIAEEAAEEARAQETHRAIDICTDDLPEAYGDPSLLRQVWFNLLSNAVKYTRPRAQARIEVSARIENGEVTYSVADNGVGYDPRYSNKLFGAFQRLHTDAEFEGTGVGLALVSRIVGRHGGRVGSTGKPDEGATFWFTLPRSKHHEHEQRS